MKRIVNVRHLTFLPLLLTISAIANAQTFKTVFRFDGAHGEFPEAALTQGRDGNLYGVTYVGGASSGGTIFKLGLDDTFTTLYSFCGGLCPNQNGPATALVQASNGDFYGTTQATLPSIYRITPSGALTTIHLADLNGYFSALIQDSTGNFFGTFSGSYPEGFVFKITPNGAVTRLYTFCPSPNCLDGSLPNTALVQGPDGSFYGTTYEGGSGVSQNPDGGGIVYKITSAGALTVLYSFCSLPACADGETPGGGLTIGADGNLYGATLYGGNLNNGTIFQITPAGVLTTLHDFCSPTACSGDSQVGSRLVAGSDGNLYGNTLTGPGAVFQLTPAGVFSTIHTFCTAGKNCADGWLPTSIMQATWGSFYGTTDYGGQNPACPDSDRQYNCGTVFKITDGLKPFVLAQPAAGPVGSTIILLGTNLQGATCVTFNGVSTGFTVNPSGQSITATVPSGATSGAVQVTLSSGALTTNVPFFVL